jgi:hypothetical protein
MEIGRFTPIVVNGKIVGAVNEDCPEDAKVIPAVIFAPYFSKEIMTKIDGSRFILNLTATLEVPEDEIF